MDIRVPYTRVSENPSPDRCIHGRTHSSARATPTGPCLRLARSRREGPNAYQEFLTLWKDADPDIPILKQAKAEYAKLHLADGQLAPVLSMVTRGH